MTAWIIEPRSSEAWALDRSGMGEVRRITQDGRVRVTEQGVVRIIERFGAEWTRENPVNSIWTTEE